MNFEYKTEVFFKEIILNIPLEINEYYDICLEFQERADSHVYSLTWILDTLNIHSEVAYIDFIENTSCQTI